MERKQNQKTNRNEKKFKVTFSLSVSFVLIFMLGFATLTYAWVFESEFSGISGMNISLAQSQGLIMTLDGNVSQTIDINSYLAGSFTTFALKEVSSDNGKDLYLRNEGTYYPDTSGIYDSIPVAEDEIGIIQFRDAIEDDRNDSFIYFQITLEATGDNRYLIFDSSSSYIEDLSNNPVNPIRASFTFIEGQTSVTHIIGERQEYLGNYVTDAVDYIDNTTDVGITTDQDVSLFEDFNGYDGATFNSSKTLYHLTESSPIQVIIRIWLEGGDPDCTNQIAGSDLNINLAFDNVADGEV